MKEQDEVVYEQLDCDLKVQVIERLELETANWVRGQYDFCVIHSEDDNEEVLEFRDNFCKTYELKGALEFDADLVKIGDYFVRIDEMIKRSTVVFMYITERFKDDDKCLLQRSDLLNRCIDDKSKMVIPVYPKKECLSMAPSGLKGMTGIKLFSKSADNLRIKTTFNHQVREMKVLRLQEEKKEWEKKIVLTRNRIAKRLLCQRQQEKMKFDYEETTTTMSNLTVATIEHANNIHLGHVINVYASENSRVVISPVINSNSQISQHGEGFKVNYMSSSSQNFE